MVLIIQNQSLPALPVRILTHNIRFATTSPFPGEELWSVRRPRLINELKFNAAHCDESFLCLQEVLHDQLNDILSGLNLGSGPDSPEWSFVGVGRDDGETRGEYSPILFKPARWELEYSKTVWLSETPEKPSKGWDAASIRILTIGAYRHRKSSRRLIVMNTHLDDQGSESRDKGARLILLEVENLRRRFDGATPAAILLTGDLNSCEGEEAHLVLDSASSPLQDIRELVLSQRRYGNDITFTGFGHEKEPLSRIDFIFLERAKEGGVDQKRSNLSAEGYGVLSNCFDDGVYISDHRAVVADVVLK